MADTPALPPIQEEVFMNDIRRTILWVIFGFSMVLLWDQWQVYNGKNATFFPSAHKPAATASAPAGTSSVPTGSTVPTPAPAATVAGAAAPGSIPPGPAPAAAGEKITVTTDLLRLTFDTEGGSLV